MSLPSGWEQTPKGEVGNIHPDIQARGPQRDGAAVSFNGYVVTFGTTPETFDARAVELDEILESWRWKE